MPEHDGPVIGKLWQRPEQGPDAKGALRMNCWQCGTPLPPDVGFCRACGAILRGKGAAVQPEPQPLRPSGAVANPAPPPLPGIAGAPRMAEAQASKPPAPPWEVAKAPVGQTRPIPTTPGPWDSPTPVPGRLPAVSERKVIPTDVIALIASAVVAIAVFLPWYSINFTAFAVQRLEAAANGLISGFFGHSFTLPSLPAGPYSLSISALDKNAGGWRWAILIVACVAVVELLIAISVRASGGSELPWPHAGVVVLLTFGNLVLVAVSLFVLPISGVSSSILTVSIQSGAVVGSVGAAVAFLSALAAMFTTEPIRR